MSEQLDLFKKTPRQLEDEQFTKEYCINYIRKDSHIWDMRHWRKDHDRKEVMEVVLDPGEDRYINDGHALYCIEKLIAMKVSKDEIVDAIMANQSKSFANRVVPCWLEECPKWKANGKSFKDNICDACNIVTKKRNSNANKKSVRAKGTDKA